MPGTKVNALNWDAFPEAPPEVKDWEPDPSAIPKSTGLKDYRFRKGRNKGPTFRRDHMEAGSSGTGNIEQNTSSKYHQPVMNSLGQAWPAAPVRPFTAPSDIFSSTPAKSVGCGKSAEPDQSFSPAKSSISAMPSVEASETIVEEDDHAFARRMAQGETDKGSHHSVNNTTKVPFLRETIANDTRKKVTIPDNGLDRQGIHSIDDDLAYKRYKKILEILTMQAECEPYRNKRFDFQELLDMDTDLFNKLREKVEHAHRSWWNRIRPDKPSLGQMVNEMTLTQSRAQRDAGYDNDRAGTSPDQDGGIDLTMKLC